ncbi:MAG: helix-turn-helix domain-containing protein [Chromatiaceae bacterium]|nr:MAG: helix-turn-helix domain-containing protein [Chromatiaceae bacterium]
MSRERDPTPVSAPVSVSLLALPESMPAALYGLFEVFSSVGVTWSELTGEPAAAARLDVRILAARAAPFPSPLGVPIAPHAGIDTVTETDIVVVTDLALAADSDPRGRWPEESHWLRERYRSGATLCSVCTGSVLLADAGLLDGQEATSHWSVTGLFKHYYAGVRLRPERILSLSGEDGRLVTSGGAAAWEDLALYLVARFCGEAEAVRLAKLFLFGDHSEGQMLYAAGARPRRHEDAVIARCQAWIAEHYSLANPVARLVAESGLAERTFKRRFQAATGYSPVEYVQALRVEEAKHLLETTRETIDLIAHRVGYEDPTFFQRLFKRRTGVTPARYRQRFQSIGRLPRGQ